jgi:hypothetical protein
MKVMINHHQYKNHVMIEFDRDLPAFPVVTDRRAAVKIQRSIFSRNNQLSHTASAMAIENAGNLPIELNVPFRDHYYSFLEELVVIPGFVSVRESNRYSLELHIGRMFNAETVGREVASTINRFFYPEESLEVVNQGESTKSECLEL